MLHIKRRVSIIKKNKTKLMQQMKKFSQIAKVVASLDKIQ